MFTLCIRILRDRAEAEDLLTDVFWEIWSKSGRYDAQRGSPLTYLLTLARSRAIDRRRTGQRHRSIVQKMAESGNGKGETDPRVGPLDGAVGKELAEKVRSAMARLEPAQREAIYLSFFDDLSHSEISAKLGKPLGTVKTYIRQGLIRLREVVRMD